MDIVKLEDSQAELMDDPQQAVYCNAATVNPKYSTFRRDVYDFGWFDQIGDHIARNPSVKTVGR